MAVLAAEEMEQACQVRGTLPQLVPRLCPTERGISQHLRLPSLEKATAVVAAAAVLCILD